MSSNVHVSKEMEMGASRSSVETEENNERKPFSERMRRLPGRFLSQTWEVGREDPRRVIHSLKVGTSLMLVALLYLLEPLFKGIGENAIWAVMTVVVVLEFTAGATLCKGVNRGLGTLLAGSLAFLIQYMANESGQVLRAVFVGSAVFVIGAAATYLRFFPCIKKNYDYGVVIFLLTFNLITVSSYRVDNVLKIAHERSYNIAIGCGICLFMTLLIFPHWSGEDLHNSTAYKLEGLAGSIEACVNRYFEAKLAEIEDQSSEDTIYKGYKAVLDSKTIDDTLALHASWEPRHSIHCHVLPWQQYVKLGTALRHFGYTVVALHGCLQTEIQTPLAVRFLFKEPCIRLAGEVSKVLMELASSIRNRRNCPPEILTDQLHEALRDLNVALKSQPRLFLGADTHDSGDLRLQKGTPGSSVSLQTVKTDTSALLEWKTRRFSELQPRERGETKKMLRPQLSKIAITSLEFSEALPFAAFASLLVEAVARLDLVVEEAEELGRIGCFKEFKPGEEITLTCEKPRVDASCNHLPSQGTE